MTTFSAFPADVNYFSCCCCFLGIMGNVLMHVQQNMSTSGQQ